VVTHQLAINSDTVHLRGRSNTAHQVTVVATQRRSEVNTRLREAQLIWLRHVEDVTGKTASEIARGAGLDPSTLTGFKTGKRSQTLESLTITQIANRWNVPVDVAVRGAPEPRGFAEETVPYIIAGADPIAAAVRALVAGRNGVDPLTLCSSAIELAGYLPGDIILVDLNGVAQPGDAVLAQVYDWQRGSAQTIVRIFEKAAPVDLLVPKSRDASLHPIVVDGEKVIVKGVLLPHRLRPARAAA
jgi:transcriptional regulator with XRE-family HTH domain